MPQIANTKETSEEFQKRRKIALRKGAYILLPTLIIILMLNTAIAISRGQVVLSIILSLIFFAVIYVPVVYFVWGPARIGGVFPSEGYIAVITRGSQAHRPIICATGKALTKGTPNQDLKDRWRVVDENDPKAYYKNKSFFGLYLFIPFLEGVHEYNLHWRKWDNTKEVAIDKNELLWQTSIMDYPHYIDKLKAELKERGSINMRTIVIMRTVGVYDALFSTATKWIDIVGPELEGAYNAFIKTKTIDELIADPQSISKMLYEFLKTYKPVIEYESDNDLFFNRIQFKYGIAISYIEVIDIEGADKETEAAIKAKNLALLQAEAIQIFANAERNRTATIASAPFVSATRNFTEHAGVTQAQLQDAFQNNKEKYDKEYWPIFNKFLEAAVDQTFSQRGQTYKLESSGSGGTATSTFEAVVAGNIATKSISNSGVESSGSSPSKQPPIGKRSGGQSQSTIENKPSEGGPKGNAKEKDKRSYADQAMDILEGKD